MAKLLMRFRGFTVHQPPSGPEYYEVAKQIEGGQVRYYTTGEAKNAVNYCLDLQQAGYKFEGGFWRKRK